MTGDVPRWRSAVLRSADVVGIVTLLVLVAIVVTGGFEIQRPLKIDLEGFRNPLLIVCGMSLLATLLGDSRRPSWLLRTLQSISKTPLPVMAAIHFGLLVTVAVQRHLSLNSGGCDLGIFENALWSSLHGDFLYTTLLERHFFGEHVSPILLLVLPLYAVFHDPMVLLVLQSAALAVGVLPIGWLARRRLGDSTAFVIVLIYVFYRPIIGVNEFDFHPIALTTPLLAFAIYYLLEERWTPFFVCIGLACLCKEGMLLYLSFFGLYIFWFQKRRRLGALLFLLGAVIFMAEVWLIIPHFRGEPFPYVDRYRALGESIPEIITTAVTEPGYFFGVLFGDVDKALYVFGFLAPLAGLSLLAPRILLLAAPSALRVALSTHPPEYSFVFHYSSPVTPVIFMAAVLGAERLRAPLARWLDGGRDAGVLPSRIVVLLALAVCGASVSYNPLRSLRHYPSDRGVDVITAVRELIPADASVSAHNSLVAQFSTRRDIYAFPRVDDAAFVVLDMRYEKFIYPMQSSEYRKMALHLVRSGEYGVRVAQDGIVCLERGRPTTPELFERFVKEARLTWEAERSELRNGKRRGDDRASGGEVCATGPRLRKKTREMVQTRMNVFPAGRYRVSVHLRGPAGVGDVARLSWDAVGKTERSTHRSLAITDALLAAAPTDGAGFRVVTDELELDAPAHIGFSLLPYVGDVVVDKIDLEPLAGIEAFVDAVLEWYP